MIVQDLGLFVLAIAVGLALDWKKWRKWSHFGFACALYAVALAIWAYHTMSGAALHPVSELHQLLDRFLPIGDQSILGEDY
jgi:Kef-type K+ transport system membrane component KefB